MTDDDSEKSYSPRDALEILNDRTGQTYMLTTNAMLLLEAFSKYVTPEYVHDTSPYADSLAEAEDTDPEERRNALAHGLADTQQTARDARGIVTVDPFNPVVTYAEVSGILLTALGGEASDATMVGSGSTADVRHEQNIEAIAERLDIDLED